MTVCELPEDIRRTDSIDAFRLEHDRQRLERQRQPIRTKEERHNGLIG